MIGRLVIASVFFVFPQKAAYGEVSILMLAQAVIWFLAAPTDDPHANKRATRAGQGLYQTVPKEHIRSGCIPPRAIETRRGETTRLVDHAMRVCRLARERRPRSLQGRETSRRGFAAQPESAVPQGRGKSLYWQVSRAKTSDDGSQPEAVMARNGRAGRSGPSGRDGQVTVGRINRQFAVAAPKTAFGRQDVTTSLFSTK